MTVYTPEFISFSKNEMRTQPDNIKRWSNDSNPQVAHVFREIIEAASQG